MHGWHLALPQPNVNEPFGQGVHEADSGVPAYVPGVHSVHAEANTPLDAVPDGHNVQPSSGLAGQLALRGPYTCGSWVR